MDLSIRNQSQNKTKHKHWEGKHICIKNYFGIKVSTYLGTARQIKIVSNTVCSNFERSATVTKEKEEMTLREEHANLQRGDEMTMDLQRSSESGLGSRDSGRACTREGQMVTLAFSSFP